MRPTVLLTALLATPALLAAQGNPLVGTWNVNVPSGMKMENGEMTPLFAEGTLVITQEGDSLIATLKTKPADDQPERPAVRLATKAGMGQVVFVKTSEATMSMNGQETKHTATSTYTFEAKGDVIKGTVAREIEGLPPGMGMSDPMPITGKRAS